MTNSRDCLYRAGYEKNNVSIQPEEPIADGSHSSGFQIFASER